MTDVLDPARTPVSSGLADQTGPKLEWPPTDTDLRRLYVDEKRSAIGIAKIYGLRTNNPRSAPYLITYHLKKHGIERRNRVAELAKETSAAVVEWSSRYPPSGSSPANPSREVEAVLELLRLPNLSVKSLDERTKQRVRNALQHLHHERGVSLNDIAVKLGNKTSGYTSWVARQVGIKPRDFEVARLKGIHEKVRKYERRPFGGTDEDKAYMLGVAHGDLHIAKPWSGAISVSTSTTHPAMVRLFRNLFSQYGHVYLLPRYKYDTQTYEWNLQVILDDSFRFLLLEHREAWELVSKLESTLYSYLAGIWDAEGSVEIRENRKVVAIRLPVYNTNLSLVEFIISKLGALGYTPWGPYLAKREGETSTKWGIPLRKDYWKAEVLDLDQSQELLAKLPLRHPEKIKMKELALVSKRGDRWQSVQGAAKLIRDCIKLERDRFLAAARVEFEVRRRRKLLKRAGLDSIQVPLPGEESPAVTCVLIRDAWRNSDDEEYEEILGIGGGAYTLHHSWRCWGRKPCVVICWGCNSRNIIPNLVHESLHHALLWINGQGREDEDSLHDAAHILEANRVRMKEFPI